MREHSPVCRVSLLPVVLFTSFPNKASCSHDSVFFSWNRRSHYRTTSLLICFTLCYWWCLLLFEDTRTTALCLPLTQRLLKIRHEKGGSTGILSFVVIKIKMISWGDVLSRRRQSRTTAAFLRRHSKRETIVKRKVSLKLCFVLSGSFCQRLYKWRRNEDVFSSVSRMSWRWRPIKSLKKKRPSQLRSLSNGLFSKPLSVMHLRYSQHKKGTTDEEEGVWRCIIDLTCLFYGSTGSPYVLSKRGRMFDEGLTKRKLAFLLCTCCSLIAVGF